MKITLKNFLEEAQKDKFKTPLKQRSMKNKPKDANHQEYLKISSNGGKSAVNDRYYGWSHRAVASFGIGDKIKKDTVGNWKNKEWIIKTENEAEKMALNFRDEVS